MAMEIVGRAPAAFVSSLDDDEFGLARATISMAISLNILLYGLIGHLPQDSSTATAPGA